MPEPRRSTNAQVRDSSFCSGRQRPENHNGDTVLAAWRIGSALTGSLVITSKKVTLTSEKVRHVPNQWPTSGDFERGAFRVNVSQRIKGLLNGFTHALRQLAGICWARGRQYFAVHVVLKPFLEMHETL